MIRVLIVDDSEFTRSVLHRLLEKLDEVEVIGQARDGHEAVELAEQLHPDIVTMDVQMPIMDGWDATQQISQLQNNPKVILLSGMWDESDFKLVSKVGAKGFVAKTDILEIRTAIRQVYTGASYYSESMQRMREPVRRR